LEKSSQGFFDKMIQSRCRKNKVDDEVLDDLEEVLIASDVGAETTIKIIKELKIVLPETSMLMLKNWTIFFVKRFPDSFRKSSY
jgi:signal recognition particle GTPase